MQDKNESNTEDQRELEKEDINDNDSNEELNNEGETVDIGYVNVGDYNSNKQWVIDTNGKILFEGKYEYTGIPFQGEVIVKDFDGNHKLMDLDGNLLSELGSAYKGIQSFTEGMAPVMQDEKYGFINRQGELVIPAVFQQVEHFLDGVALVQKDDIYILIDKKGEIIRSFEEKIVRRCGPSYYFLKKETGVKYSRLIDINGNEVLSGDYDEIDYLDGDLFLLYTDHAKPSHIVNKEGELYAKLPDMMLFEILFEVGKYHDGLMMYLKPNGKCNYINYDGKEAFDRDFDSINRFIGGYAVVTEDGVQKIINTLGEEVLNCSEYTFVTNCGCSRFMVNKGENSFIIDEKGNRIFDVDFDFGLMLMFYRNNRELVYLRG